MIIYAIADGGNHIWAITHLGFGKSEKPNIVYTELMCAELLRDLIVDIVNEPVHLVGNSIGVYFAAIVARLWPALVKSVGLINTAIQSNQDTLLSQPIKIQLAVNVQIPVDYCGLGGKAIYVDTEGNFLPKRVFQVAKACIKDMVENSHFRWKDFQTWQDKLQPNAFLENIFYFRICTYTEQVALINYFDKFISEHKDGKATHVFFEEEVEYNLRRMIDIIEELGGATIIVPGLQKAPIPHHYPSGSPICTWCVHGIGLGYNSYPS
ncbi:hypothetical protein NE237_029274 [Protea cynaroides]|uniref:Rad51-like C-terminal domain-containing protein n=1 Tax=Protea cynaroides TaxID=273540 RepID=A0A9Q0JUY2_9MAGN|nr:hypothetical protein NE237_029274 [Protea cynaroides]